MAKSHKNMFKQAWQKCKRYRHHRLGENTNMSGITSGSQLQSKQTTCYTNRPQQTKALHESTQSIEQKCLTDHEPKRHRRYDSTHVNIASFINRFRLGRKTEHGINRVMKASLRAQITQHKAFHDKKAQHHQEDMFMKLTKARASSQHAWINYNNHGKID